MDFKFVKIVAFVPVSHADGVRLALAEAGAGRIGNYDSCSFSSRGVGRFRGTEGANPFIGNVGEIEEVEEERIEVVCAFLDFERILKAVKEAHPYEEPGIDVIPLLDVSI